MKRKRFIMIIGILILVPFACKNDHKKQKPEINEALFEHHFITTDLPGESDWGYGCPTLADYDNDGDPDYSFSGFNDLYWFENRDIKTWVMHEAGTLPFVTLGATSLDVDRDGWMDILVGECWFRNSQNPKNKPFERYLYDDRIHTEIHDIVVADMNGDGENDIVVNGEDEGLFWYVIPDDPVKDVNWERTTVTLDVLKTKNRIHAGFFPHGVGDLDGDGDNDIVLPDRWLENLSNGKEWVKHLLPFGKRGPYGISSRSWIIDLDQDGDNDIVMTDCDQQASRAAWLENHGEKIPTFTSHFLPMSAPGIRGSFHSLFVGDIDNDGDADILTCEQEDDTLPPEGASPRWYVWENVGTVKKPEFVERVILDNKIGGHDILVADADGDGDLDIFSKVWNLWPGSGNNGIEHADILENKIR
jgi:hypothetical protein